MKIKLPPIIIDTRESTPWLFTSIKPMPETVNKGLKTGDYSLVGYEDSGITVERKSSEDLFGSVGRGRDRLKAEFERMEKFKYAALIVERTIGYMIKNPPENSKMLPKVIINTMLSWSIRHNVHIFTCEDRILSEKICYNLFRHFFKQQMEEI